MSKKHIKHWNLIVVGGGASGMMAAITAAGCGAHVLLLEQKEQLGKKLLATGNGRCNFTNADMELTHFHGEDALIQNALDCFSLEDTLNFFHKIGILPKQKNGYYYPNSEQAASVVSALEAELARRDVAVHTKAQVTKIVPLPSGFRVYTAEDSYVSDTVLLAVGLLAAPKLGSNGSFFDGIKELGHHFTPIVPALCGFYCEGTDFKAVSGVRAEGRITLYIDGEPKEAHCGELQFTDYGISGIPVFQISRLASAALKQNRQVQASLHFLAGMEKDELQKELLFRKEKLAEETAEQGLNGLLAAKLIPAILKKAEISHKTQMRKLSEEELERLAAVLTDFTLDLTKARDYEFAQICAGGIRTEEIDIKTLESRYLSGLFFSGELLDVDGICGGYNLQWAWSSGFLAGKSAAQRLGIKNHDKDQSTETSGRT